MEPEEIIQQKEWLQLNKEEKLIIHEIAATEQEFNLMKKIFVVSREDLDEVPEINPVVFKTLNHHLQKRKRRNVVYFLYTAAAICLLVLTLFFVLNKNERKENTIVQTETPVKMIVDTPAKVLLPDDKSQKEINRAVTNIKTPAPSQLPEITQADQHDMAVNTTVAGNTELLNFVMELN